MEMNVTPQNGSRSVQVNVELKSINGQGSWGRSSFITREFSWSNQDVDLITFVLVDVCVDVSQVLQQMFTGHWRALVIPHGILIERKIHCVTLLPLTSNPSHTKCGHEKKEKKSNF